MEATKSPLQLRLVDIPVFKLHYRIDKIKDFEKFKADYSVDLDFDVLETDKGEDELYMLRLRVWVNKNKRNAYFKIEMQIQGVFEFIEKLGEEKRTRLLIFNGFSMLYSFVRGYIYAKLDGIPPDLRVLPTINLLKTLKKKLEIDAG